MAILAGFPSWLGYLGALWPCVEHMLSLLHGTAYEAETTTTLYEVPSAEHDRQ